MQEGYKAVPERLWGLFSENVRRRLDKIGSIVYTKGRQAEVILSTFPPLETELGSQPPLRRKANGAAY